MVFDLGLHCKSWSYREGRTGVRRTIRLLVCFLLALIPCGAFAQGEHDDNPKFNDNIGLVTMGASLNPMARYTNFGLGVDLGAGYNFTRRHAIVGEFMWNWLYVTDSALEPVREALQSPNINGHGELFTVSSNYKFELRGKTFGTYFIGGPGWYHRIAKLSKPVPAGTVCINPLSVWWGDNCTPAGTTNATIASTSLNSLGFNAGMGFTIRVGEAPYRFYFESRYHYAPTKNVNTQLVSIVFGIRY